MVVMVASRNKELYESNEFEDALVFMSAIKRFWRYWCENFETAKGGFDMAALIVTVMLAAGCVLCKLVNFQSPYQRIYCQFQICWRLRNSCHRRFFGMVLSLASVPQP